MLKFCYVHIGMKDTCCLQRLRQPEHRMHQLGHPDKFCDIAADAIVAEYYRADRRAYCQVEHATWCDEIWVNGVIAIRKPLDRSLETIIREVARDIGYVEPNPMVADRYRIRGSVCQEIRDPREWTDHVNDQCVTIGWAGYDARVGFLPPGHFLVHYLQQAIWQSIKGGRLIGQGLDGKLLVRVRVSSNQWRVEHLLATVQQWVTAILSSLPEWFQQWSRMPMPLYARAIAAWRQSGRRWRFWSTPTARCSTAAVMATTARPAGNR